MLTYAEQLEARARRWWGPGAAAPSTWRRSKAGRLTRRLRQPHPFHRLREMTARRQSDDPDDCWRCCDDWQRTLGSKWNSREFAARHGCRVPELYWSGWRLSSLPWSALPPQFAVRPDFSGGRAGTYVIADGRDLLRGERHTPATLTRELRRTHTWRWLRPTLVEEFVRAETGAVELPVEYKFYMFGETVGAIEVVRRTAAGTTQAAYSVDWTRLADPIFTKCPAGDDLDPPACFSEMVASARRLSLAYGAHVRVDLYASERGCVFSEFSNRPHNGLMFTPYAQRYFGELWAAAFPDDNRR